MIMFKEWGGGEKYGTRHFIIVNRLEQGDAWMKRMVKQLMNLQEAGRPTD
jgi:hypothetical protein